VSHQQLEEGLKLILDFDKLEKIAQTGSAVVPVAVQDVDTKEVLIVAYANEQAFRHTNELWIKGANSGNTLAIAEVRVNCEQNSLLYLVRPQGLGACHTQNEKGQPRSGCYYRKIGTNGTDLEFL